MGFINPIFVLKGAQESRGSELGAGWTASLCMGVGQFCTNPGVVFAMDGSATHAFVDASRTALPASPAQTMLTRDIAQAYHAGRDELSRLPCLTALRHAQDTGRNATPALFETDGQTWRDTPALSEEVFGPVGLVVRMKTTAEMIEIARGLQGQLTATLHLDDADLETAQTLMPILEREVRRVLVNGFPTGVEFCESMVHGGPYPASANFGTTSVGTLSIRRFLRPVCYQNVPEALLPKDID